MPTRRASRPVQAVFLAILLTMSLTGCALAQELPSVDTVMTAFMTKYSVRGMSIAITRNGNLVYAKGYGKADDLRDLTTSHLFRLASLSKQITSIAIMRLMDEGKISLDQKVFGPGAILGTAYGTRPYGKGITDITVDQLLHHTAGGWTNDGQDPMFTNPSMTAGQLITWTLDHRPLTNTPGTAYAYSNFGYCILGRVIEKITGKPYADAVRDLVLQPLGITDMVIAGNTLADRRANEVKYYGQNGESPYTMNVTRMDSHGGWAATATDFARILVAVDGFSSKPDILSAAALKAMTTTSTANPHYAAGWSINGQNWFHTGALPGTYTEQARTVSRGEFNFVILANTWRRDPAFGNDFDRLFWNVLAATPVWPDVDLFRR
jgi:CubicO group peptidase (beta-lactamase class C family)